ncbi:methyltransferase family protein [Ferruginibacter albus]|uniref:methyltransferase family protein n=1 Tax=Ferruginibacter albus TaxID=2875540 RepID=UPI001CC6D298|nr:isoprenylcysteine carboxylmethyltransferase family protein [Ferruginibacter albus]UAY51126.1 isoprenylcysteine carboxylmethyltransferase family protein [Ferruginibacter albus]
MNILFIFTYLTWLLSEIYLNRFLRSNNTDKQNADKNSLLLIWIVIIVTIITALFITNSIYCPISSHTAIRFIGLCIIIIGVLLRLYIVASLGNFFTVTVTIRQDHQLKKDGFYKYLRHPSYAASLLSFIGYGVTLNNWMSLLVIVFAILSVFIIRIRIEERVLIGHFGSAYLDYKKTTKAIIPFIY